MIKSAKEINEHGLIEEENNLIARHINYGWYIFNCFERFIRLVSD